MSSGCCIIHYTALRRVVNSANGLVLSPIPGDHGEEERCSVFDPHSNNFHVCVKSQSPVRSLGT